MRIQTGNGYFTTDYAAGNTGTGVINVGTVTDPGGLERLCEQAADGELRCRGGLSTTYDRYRFCGRPSLPPAPMSPTRRLRPAGLGVSVTVSGAPANGDSFTIAASSSKSVFRSLADLIGTLERPITGAASEAQYRIDIGTALIEMDQAADTAFRVRTLVGTRLNAVTSQNNVNGDLNLQYSETLSNLQDLDYAQALSDLTRRQTNLEAAQKSFSAVTKLSLFNYL